MSYEVPPTTQPVSGTVSIVDQVDGTASGALTGAGQSVTLAVPSGSSSTQIQLSGTFVGTVAFSSSLDGGVTYNPRVYRGTGILNNLQTSASAFPSEWRGNSAGMSHLRVTCTAYTSGSLTVALRSSEGVGAVFLNAAIPIGGVSVGNAYSANLGAGASYTGTFEQMTNVAAINLFIASTQAGNLRVQYSQDGVTSAQEVVYPVTAGVALNRIIPPRAEFFRAVVDNTSGGTATTTLEVVYRAVSVQTPLLTVLDEVPSSAMGAVSKAIIQGVNTWTPVLKTVTTTAARVDSGIAGRKSITVRARNFAATTDVLYVGSSNAVASGFGVELKERESIGFDLSNGAQVWAVGSRAGGNPLEVIEIWDV